MLWEPLLLLPLLLGVTPRGADAQAPPVDPMGRCECSIFVDTERRGIIGDSVSGPLWLLQHEDTDEVVCDGYRQSACYVFCERQMEGWLNSTSLEEEVEVEVAPGVFETYQYGELFCKRSYMMLPGNDFESYEGVANAPLLLATRIAAGDCRQWTVQKEYPQRPLCCDADYQYIPEGEDCPVDGASSL